MDSQRRSPIRQKERSRPPTTSGLPESLPSILLCEERTRLTMSWAARIFVTEKLLMDLDSLLGKAGIRFAPIKGAYLVQTSLANRFCFRTMDDVDILVSPKFYSLATTVLRESGWVTKVGLSHPEIETQFVIRTSSGTAILDLHQSLNYPERFVVDVDGILERSRSIGSSIAVLTPEDALHIRILDMVSAPRPENDKEIQLLLDQDQFKLDRFWEHCRQSGTTNFVAYVLLRHTRKSNFSVIIPSTVGLYPRILARLVAFVWADRMMPWFARRLLADLAFARNRLGLIGRWMAKPTSKTTVDRQEVTNGRNPLKGISA